MKSTTPSKSSCAGFQRVGASHTLTSASALAKAGVTRDTPRKNPKNYRKEEWIAYGVEPRVVDAAARQNGQGALPVLPVQPLKRRFFVCALQALDEPEADLKTAYKAIGCFPRSRCLFTI
jgi:hypothetical protein